MNTICTELVKLYCKECDFKKITCYKHQIIDKIDDIYYLRLYFEASNNSLPVMVDKVYVENKRKSSLEVSMTYFNDILSVIKNLHNKMPRDKHKAIALADKIISANEESEKDFNLRAGLLLEKDSIVIFYDNTYKANRFIELNFPSGGLI